MKILFLTHLFYPHIGGIEVNSEILANGFSKSGHEVCLVTWAEDPENRAYPYRVIRKPAVWELIKEHRHADVVFENNPCFKVVMARIFSKETICCGFKVLAET